MTAPADNASRMALHSRCDGIKMLWRDVHADQVQDRLSQIKELLYGALDLDTAEVKKHFKHKVLRSAAERGDSLYAVELTGPAAGVLPFLPWYLCRTATKLHFKTYADEVFAGATDAFAGAVFDSSGYLQASFFNNAENGRNKKNSGSKGTRVGSRKSDSQTVVYKRQRERTGIEARVEDRLLKRVIGEVEETVNDLDRFGVEGMRNQALHRKAARVGFVKFLKELRSRGINIADYFSLVTEHATGAVLADESNTLDVKEEDRFIA